MRTFLALSLAALAAGCSSNETVLMATLVQTPAPPTGLNLTVTQTSVAQVYLGQASVTSPSAGDVKPISGATVKLTRTPALSPPEIVLAESAGQPGYYQATGPFYQAGASFQFTAQSGADTYSGEVVGAPLAPSITIPQMNSTAKIATYANYSNTTLFPVSYPIGRTPACTGLCDVAFYGVWTVTGATTFNGTGAPNCTNAPQNAADLLSFAFVSDLPWRANPFQADKAKCFPTAGPSAYVVGLTVLKKGTTSGNVGLGSSVYVGTSDAAGVIVQAY